MYFCQVIDDRTNKPTMKKDIFKTMLLLLTAGMSIACSSDNDSVDPDEVQTPVTITARYGSINTTRVAYADDGANINATWQENDKLLVLHKNMVNTLTLSSGAGASTATFKGTVKGSLKENSMLICMVKDQNNTSITINDDGSTSYTGSIFLEQDGTLAGATKCNFYRGSTQYGDGTYIGCNLIPYTSYLKFTVQAPSGVAGGQTATLTFMSGEVNVSTATFTVGSSGINIVYMAVPAMQFRGEPQRVVYESGGTVATEFLSETGVDFKPGSTLSKTLTFG